MKPWLALLLCSLPARAHAHLFPIHPVEVRLAVVQGEVRASIESNAVYWNARILGGQPPPRGWSRDTLEAAESYVRAHLRLQVDGRRLEGRLLDARYIQEPWKDWREGRVLFQMTYPLRSETGRLTVHSMFFAEFHEELEEAHDRPGGCMSDHSGIRQEFVTRLRVGGRAPLSLELPLDAPEASFLLEDALQTSWQTSAAAFKAGFGTPASRPAILLFVAAGVLFWSGGQAFLGAAALLAFAALFFPASPLPWLEPLEWASAALLAASAGLGMRRGALGIVLLSIPLWAWEVRLAAGEVPVMARLALTGGLLCSSALAACLLAVSFWEVRRRLCLHSEALSERLFREQLRWAAMLIAVCAGLLFARTAFQAGMG
ncbi:MAG: hypothetical protein WC728_10775 [Elusimicrobiota bacterium]